MDTAMPLSNTSQEDNPEVTAHHEAGHAVMARLLGRSVFKVYLVLNEKQSYNGGTCWDDKDDGVAVVPDWDRNLPYEELGLEQKELKSGVALVYVAGKAAERIWYRQRGLDEIWAGYGSGGGDRNDEQKLEKELRTRFPRMKPEELPKAKQAIEDLAVRLLEFSTCWQAIEVVAHELLKRLGQDRGGCVFEEAQACIAEVFAQTKTIDLFQNPCSKL
jgi:hypothetical protein